MTRRIFPWDADRPLDAVIARRAILEGWPEAPIDGLKWVGKGWDFDVYRAGERAFRFPRRADRTGTRKWEEMLLTQIAPVAAEHGLEVPVIERTLPGGDAFPYPITVQSWVPGTPIPLEPGRWAPDPGDPGPAHAGSAVASALRDLGAFLRSLHDLPHDALRRAGLPYGVWSLEDRVNEARDDLPELEAKIAADDPDVRPAMRWLSELRLESLPTASGLPRLLHGDITADHVLVDETGRLAGLIDWSDAMVEDPANDFVSITAQWGDAGLDAALEGYGPVGPDLRVRVGLMARATSLHWIRDRIAAGSDFEAERHRLRNAFSLHLPT